MERFEAFSTSTLRRMVVHSFMSLCTLLPSALVPSWTRKPGRRAKQIRGWSGAVVFDRDLQAPRAVTFDRFLHYPRCRCAGLGSAAETVEGSQNRVPSAE